MGTYVGNEIGLSDGKVLGITIVSLGGFPLGVYDGKDIGSS